MLKMPLKRQEIISGTQPWAGAFQTSEIIDHSRPFHLQIDAMNFGLGPVGQVISYDFAAQVGKPPEAQKASHCMPSVEAPKSDQNCSQS